MLWRALKILFLPACLRDRATDYCLNEDLLNKLPVCQQSAVCVIELHVLVRVYKIITIIIEFAAARERQREDMSLSASACNAAVG